MHWNSAWLNTLLITSSRDAVFGTPTEGTKQRIWDAYQDTSPGTGGKRTAGGLNSVENGFSDFFNALDSSVKQVCCLAAPAALHIGVLTERRASVGLLCVWGG